MPTTALIWTVLGLVLVHVVLPTADRARFARRVDLDLASAPKGRLDARFERRNRAIRLGGTSGVVVGAAIALLLPADLEGGSDAGPLLVLAGLLVGLGAALLQSSSRALQPLPADASRVARADVPTLADYVPAAEAWSVRVAVGIGAIGAAAVLVGGGAGLLGVATVGATSVLAAVLAACAVVALVLYEVFARRVVGAGQPAVSVDELAWDDALRAANLRDALAAPLALAVAAIAVALGAAAEASLDGPWAHTVVGLSGAVVLGLVVIAGIGLLLTATTKPERHFRRRLWPDPADGAR
jgi:hypothetical protein